MTFHEVFPVQWQTLLKGDQSDLEVLASQTKIRYFGFCLKVDTGANFDITLIFVGWKYYFHMKLSCPYFAIEFFWGLCNKVGEKYCLST